MKSAVLAVTCVLAGSVSSVARADQLRVTSYDMDALGGTVNLESDAPLGEPWMRIEGKMVKIWFPHIDQVSKFDHERDSSEAIKALALRAGGSDTGMLRVELGSQRHMSREDIVVTRNGQQAQVSLRMPSPKPTPQFVDPQVARAQQAAQAAAVQPVAQQPVAAAPAQPLAAAAPTEQPTAAASTPLAATGAKPDTDELGAIADDADKRGSPIVWLGLACLILGGVWAGISLMHKKKRPHELPAIEVVGSRRLGHRQELLIVRALGADHLLLCTNGHAERVASSPSPHAPTLSLPPDSMASAESEHMHERPSQAGGLGIISRMSSQHRLRKLLDSVENEAENHDLDGDASFSDELSSVTRKSRRPSLQSLPPAPTTQRPSEAVAGITRLRQRKG